MGRNARSAGSKPVAAARTNARPAHRQFLPERLVGVARRNTDWYAQAGLLARTREECPLPATPAFPCRSGTVASGRRLACFTVAGAAPVLHRLPVFSPIARTTRGVSSGWARTLRKLPHCVNVHAESRTCRQRTGVLKDALAPEAGQGDKVKPDPCGSGSVRTGSA